MNKEKTLRLRLTQEELDRAKEIVMYNGAANVSAQVVASLFSTKLPKDSGDDTLYPGWEIEEQGRRDFGIRISHPKHQSVLLYPEDKEYARFAGL